MPYLAKPSVTDAADKQQMLGLSERAVLLTEFDDLSSKLFTDKRNALKVGSIRRIYVNGIDGNLGGRRSFKLDSLFAAAAVRNSHYQ
jgi:hypothetical protein